MEASYTYLLINVATILFPLLLSFDKKVAFYKDWGALLPAIGFSATLFIIWDVYFTRIGIWQFNPAYITGIHLGPLPLEECLFFITIPYACVFIYACIKTYFSRDWLAHISIPLSWILVLGLVLGAIIFRDRLYSLVTFALLAGWLLMNLLYWKPRYLGHFYMAYVVHLIPFLLVNGILTALPVVIYNDTENIGIRIGSIPVEDTMYSMLLLLMTINVYEGLRNRIFDTKPLITHKKYA